MTIPSAVMKAAKAAGAVFSEEYTESCVLVAENWVLGVSHYRKKLRHIISQQLSFDLFDGADAPLLADRQCFSFDHGVDDFDADNNWKYQKREKFEVGLFRVRKNIDGIYPLIDSAKFRKKKSFEDEEEIYAVGFPRYLWKREIIKGNITAVAANRIHAFASLGRAVPGFSGGPVFSKDGELLGIMINNADTAGAKNIKFTRLSAISNEFLKIFPNASLPALT